MAEDEIYDFRMGEHVYAHESTYLAVVSKTHKGKKNTGRKERKKERKKGVKAKKRTFIP